jgi:NAD(P)-dependent dehydrogenase (short-subunit alcohol dehydrogenase family)
MDLQLTGKRVLVTGGSRGIGRATVAALCAEGARVATCARGQETLDEVVAGLRDGGADVVGSAVDVTDGDALENWIDSTVSSWGGIDGFVSNVSARVYRTDLERWRENFEIDLFQHIRAIEAALPRLRASQGSIGIVSSTAAMMSQLPETDRAYGPMKAALTSYASQLAQLEGANGVRVNSVSPGPIHVDGGFWDDVGQQQPKLRAFVERLSVMGRLGRPEEIAAAITFLTSPLSSYTTAANLHVDGGTVKSVRY